MAHFATVVNLIDGSSRKVEGQCFGNWGTHRTVAVNVPKPPKHWSWSITHLPTGALLRHVPSLDEAKEFAQAAAAIEERFGPLLLEGPTPNRFYRIVNPEDSPIYRGLSSLYRGKLAEGRAVLEEAH
jgi:hypothetical protein